MRTPPYRIRILRASTACIWAAVIFAAHVLGQNEAPAPETLSTSSAPKSQSGEEYWWSDRFDMVRFSNRSSSHYFINSPTAASSFSYFPPMPPPLGAEYSALGTLLPNGPSAPPQLAPFAYDLFYPFLGSRLAADELPRQLQLELQTYQHDKSVLQEGLRSRLAELKGSDPETTRHQLAAFAESQAPAIAALETSAEKLRTDLRATGLLGWQAGSDWSIPTDWPEFDVSSQPPEKLQLEANALLRSAYYQEGLSAEQRRLLREAAHETALAARAAISGEPSAAGTRWIYFSPDTARIPLPPDLPPLLQKSIADYTAVKAGLKSELHAALRNPDTTGSARSDTLKKLATVQAPRLAALEALAEEIRRALITLPDTDGSPVTPTLTPELAARISTYRRHKVELLKTLHTMLAGDGGESSKSVKGKPTKEKSLGLQESVADFNRRQSDLLADLNRENLEIRQGLAEFARATGHTSDRKSVDDLLQDFENARQRQEVWAKYREYQQAVLMPGLSPGQRRLLFDSAIAQLSLPLPSGERMP